MSFEIPPGALEAENPWIRKCPACDLWELVERDNGVWQCADCGYFEPLEPELPAEKLPSPDDVRIGKFQAEPHPTALRGAVKVYPRSGTQRRLILDAIAAAGERGLTHDEIAAVPGVADTAHRTRKTELVEDGWVEDSGRTRPTVTGTDAIVWVLTEQGRRELST